MAPRTRLRLGCVFCASYAPFSPPCTFARWCTPTFAPCTLVLHARLPTPIRIRYTWCVLCLRAKRTLTYLHTISTLALPQDIACNRSHHPRLSPTCCTILTRMLHVVNTSAMPRDVACNAAITPVCLLHAVRHRRGYCTFASPYSRHVTLTLPQCQLPLLCPVRTCIPPMLPPV